MIGFALFYLHKYQTIPKYHEEQNNMDDSGDSGYACLQHDIAEKCAVNKSLSDLHNFEEVWSSNGIHIKYLESNANNLFVITTEYSGIAQFSITFGGSTTNFSKEYAESLAQTTGMIACITDHDQVGAASGQGSRELMGKAISKELDRVITEREMKCYHTGERKILPLVENQKESSSELIVQPIICSGDAIGSVALVGKSAGERFGNSEQMLVKTAAGFLGRQMEQ